MAAWTLPRMIADWICFLSTGLDRRSRKSLPGILLGRLLSRGRRTVSSWLQALADRAESQKVQFQTQIM